MRNRCRGKTEEDLYLVLGIEGGGPHVSQREIRKAYRSRALIWHPDKQVRKKPADITRAAVEFEKVQKAYEVLGDKQDRKAYDRLRHYSENLEKPIEDLERSVEDLRRAIEDLRRAMEDLRRAIEDLLRKMEDFQREMEDWRREREDRRREREDRRREVEDLGREMEGCYYKKEN